MLREARQRQGKTLKQVAAQTDLSVVQLSRIERALRAPSLHTLGKLSAVLVLSNEEIASIVRAAATSDDTSQEAA